MNYNPILIVHGEPNSVFFEIFFKAQNSIKVKSPIILISSEKLLKLQMNKLGLKKKINLLNYKKLQFKKLNNKLHCGQRWKIGLLLILLKVVVVVQSYYLDV